MRLEGERGRTPCRTITHISAFRFIFGRPVAIYPATRSWWPDVSAARMTAWKSAARARRS